MSKAMAIPTAIAGVGPHPLIRPRPRLAGERFHEPPHRLVLSEQSESNGFLDSAVGLARNDTFFVSPSCQSYRGPPICHPDRESGATFHTVIPTERAERTSGGIYGRKSGGRAAFAESM